MIKTILYTSNPNFVPNSMEQVENFAESSGKYYTCLAEDNSKLSDLHKGAHVLTSKGNNVYILDVAEGTDFDFAKTSNITGIVKVDYPFDNYQPVCTSTKLKNSSNSSKSIYSRLKDMFMPTEANDVRIATDGNICVETNNGYVTIDAENNLVSYPEEMTLDLPVIIISKPKEQLNIGDIIVTNNSYAKVTKIAGNKITAISYTGAGKIVHTIKDFLFNQTMIRVVVSLAGNIGGQINPMMLMMMSNTKNKKSLLPLLMMNQNGGALNINPMMLMMMEEDGTSMKDLLMMSAISGNNIFGNIFGAKDK